MSLQIPSFSSDCQLFLHLTRGFVVLHRWCSVTMFSARRKIQKDKDVEPTEFEDSVAQVDLTLTALLFLMA